MYLMNRLIYRLSQKMRLVRKMAIILVAISTLSGFAIHAAAGKAQGLTSTGLTPLNDMSAADDYMGEEGGLYGNGVNSLPVSDPHWIMAEQAALQVQPRDSMGEVDDFSGKIGFISVGMSNTRSEFGTFMSSAHAVKSNAVVFANGAQPGMTASRWADADLNDDPWASLSVAVGDAGLTAEQVQVVWLKQANAAPQPGEDDFPVYAEELRDDLAAISKKIKEQYPRVQFIYLSSRIYAGYSTGPLNPETFAYESAFSVRWLIEDQRIGGGFTGVNYQNAPVLLWGPYLWADSTSPRSDGLVWMRDDLSGDGVHPSSSGNQKVADLLIEFFTTDQLTGEWFLPDDTHIPGKDCSITSVGLTPLSDMTTSDEYFGEDGGLYGSGMNSLPTTHPHWEKAYQATLQIRPRNASGNIDAISGKIGLISIGMSNARSEFGTFTDIADGEKSDEVVLVNGAQPGKVASEWAGAGPDSDPWKFLAEAISEAGLTPNQVQVVWLKQANAGPQIGEDDFPVYAQELRDDTAVIVKRVKELYPNVQLVYLSSRIYAGYSLGPLSPEPFAYEGAFSARWLIQDQINGGGATGTTYQNAPVLMWGPYLWADGTTPRNDGLVWNCEDLTDDGVHPADSGRLKVAEMLLDFFSQDPLANIWFLPTFYQYLPGIQN